MISELGDNCRPDSKWFVELIGKMDKNWTPEECQSLYHDGMYSSSKGRDLAVRLAIKVNPEAFTLIQETFKDDSRIQNILYEMFEGIILGNKMPLALYLVQMILSDDNSDLLMQFLPYFSIASPKIIQLMLIDILDKPDATKDSVLSALEFYKSAQ